MRLLIVGFDGATFNIINPLIAAGKLPTLARLIENGASGILSSTVPPITPTAWTSVFTGKRPDKHGIYDFQAIAADYSRQTVRSDRHNHKTLWQLLNEHGLRTIITDVPFTYPPRPLDGVMITGYGTPRTADTVFTYPADLAAQLPPQLRSHLRVALPHHNFDRSQAFIDEFRQIMQERAELLHHLMSAAPWDLFFHVFSITDTMAHVFWTYLEPLHPNYSHPQAAHYRQALFDAYIQCDELLGRMIAWAGDDVNVLVISDHGFGSIYPRQYLFQRLASGNYLRFAAAPIPGLGDRLMKAAINIYSRFPFLREWVKGLAPEKRSRLKRTLDAAGILPEATAFEPAQSQILPTDFGLQMWLNRHDRFDHGMITNPDTLLAELRQYLLADRDTVTETPIIENVHLGRDLYREDSAAPDLVIEYHDYYDPSRAATAGARNPQLEGGHTPDGILIAAGSHIDQRAVASARLIDLTPTVLHLFGLPIPPDMDGRVLTELLTDDRPPRTAAQPALIDTPSAGTYSQAEDADLREQLRQLGYIE